MEQGDRRRTRKGDRPHAYFITTVLLLLTALASNSRTLATEPKIKFNIPADRAVPALLEYSRQTRLPVLLLATDQIEHLKTKAVVGEFEPAEALALMLRGTPLNFDIIDDRVTVHSPQELNRPSPSMASSNSGSRSAQLSWPTATAVLPD